VDAAVTPRAVLTRQAQHQHADRPDRRWFTGSAANTYTYDHANQLTSWNNGSTTVTYGYDGSGNRTQAGAQTFTYDARDRLSSGAGSTYTYTARGTLAGTITGSITVNSTYDAFGQAITQGASTYGYDALGRVVRTGFSYTGAGNILAADGTAAYTRDPGGGVLGVKTATASVFAWTDQHTDIVGQFTATSTALAGSATYDPLGKPVAGTGLIGDLGFQSGWTDQGTGRVNMAVRWYNPDTGQFDSRDSVQLNPVPNPSSANPFGYAAGNPLTGTDPSGHCVGRDYGDLCPGQSLDHQWQADTVVIKPPAPPPPHCGRSGSGGGAGCGHPVHTSVPDTGAAYPPPHDSHGNPIYTDPCPRDSHGGANGYANCTTVVAYADGNVSINGVVIKQTVWGTRKSTYVLTRALVGRTPKWD
jgi:RHS repeat-associated protein